MLLSKAMFCVLLRVGLGAGLEPSSSLPAVAAGRLKLARSALEALEQPIIDALETATMHGLAESQIQPSLSDVSNGGFPEDMYDSTFQRRLRDEVESFVKKCDPTNQRQSHKNEVPGDSSNLEALLALAAARCRIGIDVAKAKFDSESWTYCRLVGEGQIEDVMSLLTNEIVEKAVIERVTWRATFKAQGLVPGDGGLVGGGYTQVSDPLADVAARFYKELLIPMTKDLEVSVLVILVKDKGH